MLHASHYYMHPKYESTVKLCYMNPNGFIYETEIERF